MKNLVDGLKDLLKRVKNEHEHGGTSHMCIHVDRMLRNRDITQNAYETIMSEIKEMLNGSYTVECEMRCMLNVSPYIKSFKKFKAFKEFGKIVYDYDSYDNWDDIPEIYLMLQRHACNKFRMYFIRKLIKKYTKE